MGRWTGIGILLITGGVLALGMALRQPAPEPAAPAQPAIQTNMILGIVFAEAVAIYCLVVALIILFVLQ